MTLLSLSLVALPPNAVAQIRPGIARDDYWGDVRARYRSETLEAVGTLMSEWISAWNGGDIPAMVDAFADEGVLVLDGLPMQGKERIRGALEAREPYRLQQSLADFDVRGEMAFATVRHRRGRPGESGTTMGADGLELWVFVKQDGHWKVRSLIFVQGR